MQTSLSYRYILYAIIISFTHSLNYSFIVTFFFYSLLIKRIFVIEKYNGCNKAFYDKNFCLVFTFL